MVSSDVRVRINLEWSDWIPIRPPNKLQEIPKHGGVCRITHIDTGGIEYIGRSYNDLRNRIQKLSYGVRSETEPESRPHVAAPHLWRLKEGIGSGFMVSWIGIESNNIDEIDGIWATYLSNYRHITGRSPAANFGKTVKLPGRYPEKHGEEKPLFTDYRSYQTDNEDQITWEGWKEVTSRNWMGLEWSKPHKLNEFGDPFPDSSGIYRIQRPGLDVLERIEATSSVRKRIHDRADTISNEMEISYCEVDITGRPSATEIEVDLLAAHYTAKRITPDSDERENLRASRAISEKAKELIQRSEDNSIEFKDFRSSGKKLAKELVALANSGGGEVFIGVTDNGTIQKIPDIDQTEQTISNVTNDLISPRLRLKIRKPTIDGRTILWITVPEAHEVLYSVNGRFLMRSGSQTSSLEWEDLQRFIIDNPGTLSRILNSEELNLTDVSPVDESLSNFNQS